MKSDILSRYYQLLCFMINNNYKFVLPLDKGVGFFKNKYKLNLFIIRKNGMKIEIIDNIIKQIKKEYQILDTILIRINNKQKFLKKFYENYNNYKEEIESQNDNECFVIITNRIENIEPNNLKNKIRKEYIHLYPPLGNIIHSSDSTEDCEKELELLLNEKLDNFNNIGTYYSQKKI